MNSLTMQGVAKRYWIGSNWLIISKHMRNEPDASHVPPFMRYSKKEVRRIYRTAARERADLSLEARCRNSSQPIQPPCWHGLSSEIQPRTRRSSSNAFSPQH